MRWLTGVVSLLTALMCLLATGAPSFAAESHLAEFLAKAPPAEIVPRADRYGPPEGSPPFVRAFAGPKPVGYAFVNADWVNSTGYSGQPIQILVGLTPEGKISGARLMAHHEPIVLVGIPPRRSPPSSAAMSAETRSTSANALRGTDPRSTSSAARP